MQPAFLKSTDSFQRGYSRWGHGWTNALPLTTINTTDIQVFILMNMDALLTEYIFMPDLYKRFDWLSWKNYLFHS